MSKGEQPRGVFDVERIRQIIKLMEQHDLSEVDLQQEDEKIKLKRGFVAAPVAAPVTALPPLPLPAQASATGDGGAATSSAGTITINAPMVGTFYSRPKPESEPFVKVGDTVREDTIVCIVEAMKVFSEIPAECNGRVVEVLLGDHSPVDFGKPMFRIQPTS